MKPFLLCLSCLSVLLFTSCQSDKSAKSVASLRISAENDVQTLDPRKVRALGDATAMHMLYEGLMREQEGGAAPALAKEVVLSPDQKNYTFHLRKSNWSDGSPVTATDFVETWKSILNPNFPSPNAYQLYPIRGAQAAKEGVGSLSEVGVWAKDDATLVVELERPTPYFLDLAATYFLYPVHTSLRKGGDAVSSPTLISNGPFQLERWSLHNELTAIPNPHYWDKDNVHLESVHLIFSDPSVALQLFHSGEIDWVGSPLSILPVDALSSLEKTGVLRVAPAAGVYFFRVNTGDSLLRNRKMRQALSLAINRYDLVTHVLQGKQIPATGVVPPLFGHSQPYFKDADLDKAKALLEEALKEEGMDTPPSLSIHYATGERNHKIAQVAEQQWKSALGLPVVLRSFEAKTHFEKLKTGDYQLAVGAWFADLSDPLSFLDIFKKKDNGTNNTKWESAAFIALLDKSAVASSPQERKELLRQAEGVLMSEMPVIPLFYSTYNYATNSHVKGVYFSKLGYLDVKGATIE